MSRTVDQLQKHLQTNVFHYAQDSKKAAGRALGTIVELITYYKICGWGLSKYLLIEKRIPEFGRHDIRHNVEFSLHRSEAERLVEARKGVRVSAKALATAAGVETSVPTGEFMSSDNRLRNAAIIHDAGEHAIVANLVEVKTTSLVVAVTKVEAVPRAIFECKRVGVEEGMKKGPQSIEKAKQGAYVARSVSALQRIIDRDGHVLGYLPTDGGQPIIGGYDDILSQITSGRIEAPEGFVLTVGVTSNHGNWFTAEDHNKEMKVLAAAYDWLLFLTDEGLTEFVETCLLGSASKYAPVRKAFLASYSGVRGLNRFTKTRIDLEADQVLRRFFKDNGSSSDQWFNIISPRKGTLPGLAKQLQVLLK